MATTHAGYSFDASELFRPSSVPSVPPGAIVLRVPVGLTPVTLRQTDIGKQLIWQDNTWYDEYPWANEPIAPGTYHLRLPVPDSNDKTFDEQKTLLLESEEVAPLVLVELAILCLDKAGLPDPFETDWTRCQETAADGSHVGLGWHGGRLRVHNFWVDYRDDGVWMSSVRTS